MKVSGSDRHPFQAEWRAESALPVSDSSGWVGVDRGLAVFLVAATTQGAEVARVDDPSRALAVGVSQLQQLSKMLSRKKKGSGRRRRVALRLARYHRHIAAVRRDFLHRVTNKLVKTHDRLVIEDLNVAGVLRNRRSASAISDAAWGEFARLLTYKQQWRGGTVVVADRWYPSSKRCSSCGVINSALTLAERIFLCECGFGADRDTNAAVNLAVWATMHNDISRSPDLSTRGRVNKARRREGAGRHHDGVGGTGLDDAGTETHSAPAPT
ncbi:IS200/IS605 family element transposase accessory protein TnpB [Nocardia seriolae]|nr:IS200/IS605 family element transposase accessory protein TnpB [Nocardia seriolae]MTJ71488.1 IS200/IS605 family element transposase accessory protein TnpB [Nocardia seriolae]MTJ88448.1 IS200/IS605 family element transposase accessory protein TnpB [Nocardia seriolae]MTK32432.1 IS200/IS605 family element transposase accessory protein TnpB [Nocardia seriolae]MTK41780.1 IS200/IS605 family element transposase accessory protein TnpB [Nocardia seriolae]